MPDAALLIISGTDSGGTFFGPDSISSSLPRSSVPMPPMPVPITQPIRSESYGFSPLVSQPASASASSPATIANCEKRSARRASLIERWSVGSNSDAAPLPSSIPLWPASQRS